MNNKNVFLQGFLAGKHILAGADNTPLDLSENYDEASFLAGLITALGTAWYIPTGVTEGFLCRELASDSTAITDLLSEANMIVRKASIALEASVFDNFYLDLSAYIKVANTYQIFVDAQGDALNLNDAAAIFILHAWAINTDDEDGIIRANQATVIKLFTRPLLLEEFLSFGAITNAGMGVIKTRPIDISELLELLIRTRAAMEKLLTRPIVVVERVDFNIANSVAMKKLLTRPIIVVNRVGIDVANSAAMKKLLARPIAVVEIVEFNLSNSARMLKLKTKAIASDEGAHISYLISAESAVLKVIPFQLSEVIQDNTVSSATIRTMQLKLLNVAQADRLEPIGSATLGFMNVLKLFHDDSATIDFNYNAYVARLYATDLNALANELLFNNAFADVNTVQFRPLSASTIETPLDSTSNMETLVTVGLDVFEEITITLTESANMGVERPVPPASDWVTVEGTNLLIRGTYYNRLDDSDNTVLLVDDAYYEDPVQSGTNLHITSEGYNDYGIGSDEDGG